MQGNITERRIFIGITSTSSHIFLYRELKAFYVLLNLPDVPVKQCLAWTPVFSFQWSARQFAKQCHSTGLP